MTEETEEELYSVNRLKKELGMKPKPEAVPEGIWRNSYTKVFYDVYKLSDCEPIIIKERTEKQKRATIKMLIANKLRKFDQSHYQETLASKRIKKLFEGDFLILDTSTTGLTWEGEIIELAIIDRFSEIVFQSRYKPSKEISNDAHAIHGICADDLKNEKTFDIDAEKIRHIFQDKTVVIFNAKFDMDMLENTLNSVGLDYKLYNDVNTLCAMQLAADAYGATNYYGSISLSDAFRFAEGDDFKGKTALEKCQSTLFILNDIEKTAGAELIVERIKLEERLKKETGLSNNIF